MKNILRHLNQIFQQQLFLELQEHVLLILEIHHKLRRHFHSQLFFFFPDFQKYFGLLSPEQKKIVKNFCVGFMLLKMKK